MAIKLIAGLGNPGPQYEDTRHNAGAWVVGALAAAEGVTLTQESKFKSLTAKITIAGSVIHTIVPTTFMNESGQAVVAVASFYKIAPEEILIVHDELDLAVGVVRLKLGGGHGGHNGLRNIMQLLGSRDFARLRLGIGHPGNKNQVTNYVLKRASADEQALLDVAVNDAVDVVRSIFERDFDSAMKALHTD